MTHRELAWRIVSTPLNDVERRHAPEFLFYRGDSHGAVIVSGLAECIDAAAHRAAMDSGGRTVAVMGTPLDRPYPDSNRAPFEHIAADHISQVAMGSQVRPENLPMRNRTMALISHATIIVEAGEKSGTLHQAWEALRLGRPLFIHIYPGIDSQAVRPPMAGRSAELRGSSTF